ncbi:MAG: DNA mismatch repair protein MutH [Thermoplasmata archaeon]|nr:DNA mismatch repair protein MutH [Thermoplasmata archaeon]
MNSVETFEELTHRLNQIVGVPFGELGGALGVLWRGTATQNKGWAGNLVDRLIGSDAGNLPEPDLTKLGIEVKTIPIGIGPKVLQPTKVTMLNYGDLYGTEWWESDPFHKLRSVLFVPIVKFETERPDEWFIRHPFLWLPSFSILSKFKQDYDSVRTLVRSGEFERISSAKPPNGQGVCLHPKPAAKNSAARRKYKVGDEVVSLPPRAWMLRESFTQQLVGENLRLELRSVRSP